MIGAKNCCNLQLEDFDSETKISKLFGKMANIVYESNSMGKSALESANLKAATGGGTDTLGGRFLYKDGFEFISYGKHFFGMNDFPAIIDRTLAVFARIYLVRFDRIFEGREQKKDLANEIIKDELPGIFNWAFAGLKRLRERGYALQVPESMNVEKIYFMRQGNPLLAFMLDTFEPTEEDIRTDLRPIYHDHYKSFMLEHFEDKKPLKSVSKFIEGVEKLGYKVLRPQRTPMLAGYRFREA
jgi:putative DNA primase/helicase